MKALLFFSFLTINNSIFGQPKVKQDSIPKDIYRQDYPDKQQVTNDNVQPKKFQIPGDTTTQYLKLTNKADSLFSKQDYKKAALLYELAFENNHGLGKVKHRYKAASCYALLQNNDSAFIQLNIIATKGKFSDYDLLTNDVNFIYLQKDSRWKPLLELINENRKNKGN